MANECSAMKFLIIQTANIGDVILATSLVEKIKSKFPSATIDFLLKKGNEELLLHNPHIDHVFLWDKSLGNVWGVLKATSQLRGKTYNYVINCQRRSVAGILTRFSRADFRIGFKRSAFSVFLNHKARYHVIDGIHEIERNQELINFLTDNQPSMPKLYPSKENFGRIAAYSVGKYICIAPASKWFTKQFPAEKWEEFINCTDPKIKVYLIGSESESAYCEAIAEKCKHPHVFNLAGRLHLLDVAALMKNARMNYVNDSAPLHIASAVNANVKVVFCCTMPQFGFGPLSDHSEIIETDEPLACRPCSAKGLKACPEKHFKCAWTIDVKKLLINPEKQG
jgi:ADP-heptose:LPS heptosyltransferase